MKNPWLLLIWLLFLSGAVGCEQKARLSREDQSSAYSYSLTVADTSPYAGVEASLEVRTPQYSKQGPQASTFLYVFSNFRTIRAKGEKLVPASQAVPLDTLRLVLSRAQTDTIYQLARDVFHVPQQPAPGLGSLPLVPYPNDHRLGNFLVVEFSPNAEGPSLTCSGDRKHNKAAYVLQAYLSRLRNVAGPATSRSKLFSPRRM